MGFDQDPPQLVLGLLYIKKGGTYPLYIPNALTFYMFIKGGTYPLYNQCAYPLYIYIRGHLSFIYAE